MKKIKFLTPFLLVVAAIFTSCAQDSEDCCTPPPVDPNASYLSVTINGENFVATDVQARREAGDLYLIARNENGNEITMAVPGTAEETYTNADIHYFTLPDGYLFMNNEPGASAKNGFVNIISAQQYSVSGTFGFTGYEYNGAQPPMVFTNGMFQNIPVFDKYTEVGLMGALIDGEQVSFGYIEAYYFADKMLVTGYDPVNNISFSMTLPPDAAPGTYQLNDDVTGTHFILLRNGSEIISAEGTVTVTDNFYGVLRGTFNFTGVDEEGNIFEVSAGEIDIFPE